MSKATSRTAETIEFPTFDAEKATDQMRVLAEKGVEQSKEAYARMKNGMESAQKTMETTLETARAAGSDVSLKSIAAMRANAEAGFSHFEALAAAKSLTDVIELQTSYLRKSFEMLVDQTRDMQSVSTKAAEQVAQPVRDAFENALKELKVA